MVKDHLDSERGNPLTPLHGLLFPISSKGSFICTTPTYSIAYTTVFVTLVVEHWLERDRQRDRETDRNGYGQPICCENENPLSTHKNASFVALQWYRRIEIYLVVRAFSRGAMGWRIDPLWWTYSGISCYSQCSTTGVIQDVVCPILSVG